MVRKHKVFKYEKYFPENLDLEPMKLHIPKWYKELPQYNEKESFWNRNSIKTCIPFLDSLTSGYAVLLPVDLLVERRNGFPYYSWSSEKYKIVEVRPDHHAFIPILPGFSVQKPAWQLPVALNLPNGYSMLITHPFNRFDLPFLTLSGVVDNYKMAGGSLPFIMKDDFEGVIPAGTPIAQILPFKRENWKAKTSKDLVTEAEVNKVRSTNLTRGWYKATHWRKKTYE